MALFEALVVLGIVAGVVFLLQKMISGFNQRRLERVRQQGQALELALRALSSRDLQEVRKARLLSDGLPQQVRASLEEMENDLVISSHN